jgi:hypothetical protein
MGGPLGKTKKVTQRGIDDVSNDMGAFTVVRADSHEAAAKLFDKHPHFFHFPGRFCGDHARAAHSGRLGQVVRAGEPGAILAFVTARCASIRSRSDSALASSVTSESRAAEGESFRDGASPGPFARAPRNPGLDRGASASYHSRASERRASLCGTRCLLITRINTTADERIGNQAERIEMGIAR